MMSKAFNAYEMSKSTPISSKGICWIVSAAFFLFLIWRLAGGGGGGALLSAASDVLVPSSRSYVKALTWNIAAINNNPFEYWITADDPSYNTLMSKVSKFIESPGAADVTIGSIFSDSMYDKLEERMRDAKWTGIEETRAIWSNDYKNRKIISQFIKDEALGKKRLASMPDRVTNTITTTNEGVINRPTVINCYADGDMGSLDLWFPQWLHFMFDKSVSVKKGSSSDSKLVRIRDMLQPIKRSKYPALSQEEERISIPLQVVSCAIFDAILVHAMNKLANNWQALRTDMCSKLNHHKLDRTIEILETTYADMDIQFLQEVAGVFAHSIQGKKLNSMFDTYYPAAMDADRDQNSFILLKKGIFTDVQEVTSHVLDELAALSKTSGAQAPVMKGDLICLTAIDPRTKSKLLLASFHGDTNGLATVPVVTAVYNYLMNQLPQHKLLFGMDANTYASPDEDQQGVVKFAEFYSGKKLNSCYGQHPNPLNFTTFHARTHLQPQLNKAVSLEDKNSKGDKNPKDFILFFDADYTAVSTTKDNTGKKEYIENMVFPTLKFPSDHGITSTLLLDRTSVIKSLRDSN